MECINVMIKVLIFSISLFFLTACQTPELKLTRTEAPGREKPIIIAHRGASGYMPEHTWESYKRAIELGADFVEPDLVITKDGVLIIRHENELSKTTNVSLVFPNRKVVKTIEGQKIEGWFAEDFTLEEIKTLKGKQSFPLRPQIESGDLQILTFEEFLERVKAHNQTANKKIGIYPEIKHSTYFKGLGFNLENELIRLLKKTGWDNQTDLIFIQSFEVSNLKWLSQNIKVPLIQLIGDPEEIPYDLKDQGTTFGKIMTLDGLKDVATYACGIGPSKKWLVELNGETIKVNSIVELIKKNNLKIHPYTFRNESHFITKPFKNPKEEYVFYKKIGVDGFFTDFPDTAVKSLAVDVLSAEAP